jgi:uncharacterized protein YcfL
MKRLFPLGGLAILLALFFLVGCEHDTSNEISNGGGGGPVVTDLTCIGCHSSEEMLQEALGGEKGSKVAVAFKSDG